MAREFRFTVTDRLAVLSEKGNYTKELRRVAFGDGPAKLDVRKWSIEGDSEKIGKGISLTDEEAVVLRDALNKLEI